MRVNHCSCPISCNCHVLAQDTNPALWMCPTYLLADTHACGHTRAPFAASRAQPFLVSETESVTPLSCQWHACGRTRAPLAASRAHPFLVSDRTLTYRYGCKPTNRAQFWGHTEGQFCALFAANRAQIAFARTHRAHFGVSSQPKTVPHLFL